MTEFNKAEENYQQGWYGVDLDGCLAKYDYWRGSLHIGKPIPKMVNRIKNWRRKGIEVRIFTARVHLAEPEDIKAIQDWCKKHIGEALPVTNCKDYGMRELWDDRVVQVMFNTGETLAETFGVADGVKEMMKDKDVVQTTDGD